MTYAARVDANQPDIMSALRKVGAAVWPLFREGGGCPDLLVGFRGRNYLFEVKDGSRPPSERKLNEDQEKWHGRWTGQVAVVESPEQAVAVLMSLSRLAA
jgi:hypothetical protein